ncbi:hypothetical protein OAM67_00155 [bacterium]|nr:hypothetical protein [bacterium]
MTKTYRAKFANGKKIGTFQAGSLCQLCELINAKLGAHRVVQNLIEQDDHVVVLPRNRVNEFEIIFATSTSKQPAKKHRLHYCNTVSVFLNSPLHRQRHGSRWLVYKNWKNCWIVLPQHILALTLGRVDEDCCDNVLHIFTGTSAELFEFCDKLKRHGHYQQPNCKQTCTSTAAERQKAKACAM